ncbi:outer membrane beta-barrel protein [uncultured Cohaesibacter sp.]|uniref:outer membrane protein n=1 Tax=uncultured Cohaesibacter sp. TaxID=1002546 RepID=UPI002AA61588|nr:outer membrane beta-barrel protein [uncultured Cohaesibacter sp.]
MKRVIVSSAVVLMAATGASMAADLPQSDPIYTAPPAPAEVMSGNPWEGAYAGVAIGGIWSETDSNVGASSVDGDGMSLGGYAGYNMVYDHVVFGPELLANYNTINDKSSTTRFESNWDAELRARAGYDMGFFMPYAAVGVGFQDGELTDRATDANDDNVHTFVGLTGGVEAMVTENVSMRAEAGYRWSDEKTYNLGGTSSKTDIDGTVAKVGLSYHF